MAAGLIHPFRRPLDTEIQRLFGGAGYEAESYDALRDVTQVQPLIVDGSVNGSWATASRLHHPPSNRNTLALSVHDEGQVSRQRNFTVDLARFTLHTTVLLLGEPTAADLATRERVAGTGSDESRTPLDQFAEAWSLATTAGFCQHNDWEALVHDLVAFKVIRLGERA